MFKFVRKYEHDRVVALLCSKIQHLRVQIMAMAAKTLDDNLSAPRLKDSMKTRWFECQRLRENNGSLLDTVVHLRDQLALAAHNDEIVRQWMQERDDMQELLNERAFGSHTDPPYVRLRKFADRYDRLTDELASSNGRLREIDQAPIRS